MWNLKEEKFTMDENLSTQKSEVHYINPLKEVLGLEVLSQEALVW